MKRFFVWILTLLLVLSLGACGGKDEPAGGEGENAEEQTPAEDSGEENGGADEQPSDSPQEEGGGVGVGDGPIVVLPSGSESGTESASGGNSSESENGGGTQTPAGSQQGSASGSQNSGSTPGSGSGTQAPANPQQGGTSSSQPSTPSQQGSGGTQAPANPQQGGTSGGQNAESGAPETPPAGGETGSGESSEIPTEGIYLAGFYEDLVEPYGLDSLGLMSEEQTEAHYPGLTDIPMVQCVHYAPLMTGVARELTLIQVENSEDVESVKAILQARIDAQIDGGAYYLAMAEQWEKNARIVVNGNYLMLAVDEQSASIEEDFNALFS